MLLPTLGVIVAAARHFRLLFRFGDRADRRQPRPDAPAGKGRHRAAARCQPPGRDREKLIGALLLGNTFINILASSLATQLLETRSGHRAVAVTTAVMTVVILVFAEVLPKTLAIARTDRFALAVAAPLRRVVSVLAPIVAPVQWLVWRVLFLFGVETGRRRYHRSRP